MTEPPAILLNLRAATRDAALALLAREAAATTGLPPAAILARLQAREALGSTGIGQGLALPHARIDSLATPRAWLARLARPVDWGAVDDRPVDLVALLLSPAAGDAHLSALATLARRLRDPAVTAALRAARTAADAARALA